MNYGYLSTRLLFITVVAILIMAYIQYGSSFDVVYPSPVWRGVWGGANVFLLASFITCNDAFKCGDPSP
jgi:hypothetical protein